MRKKIVTTIIFLSVVSLFVNIFSIECVAQPVPPDIPSGFTATAMSRTLIDLTWIKGENADTTYIERNSSSSWSRGEGKLIYNDTGTSFEDTTGLSQNSHYYYQAWSWNKINDVYSSNSIAANTTTFANHLPIFSEINPADNEGNIAINTPSVSVLIQDPDGDVFDWTIQGQYVTSASANGDRNGTKSASLITPLPYSINIIWYVNATDGSGWNHTDYNFTTRAQYIPGIPSGFTATTMNRTHINLAWMKGENADRTYIERNSVSSWNRGEGTLIYNDTGMSYQNSGLSENVHYYYQAWSWNNTDYVFNTTFASANAITFANLSPIFSGMTPADGLNNVNINTMSVSVLISDPAGYLFNWSITTSPNVGNNSGINDNNGTKICTISTLAYHTTYTWIVRANDGYHWTNQTYHFSTLSKSGGGGGGEPPVEPQNKKPIANASAGEPYHGLINSTILFDGSKSYDPDGTITKWLWVFGDNTNGTGKTISHIYLKTRIYTVTLTVTDNKGATNTYTTTCTISKPNNRPPTKPIITGTKNGPKNTTYTYTALSTDADNNLIQYWFDWGDPLSLNQVSGFLLNGTSFIASHSWATAGRYNVTVTVTDNQTVNSSKITVYIDAIQTGSLGYLLDTDGDGIYDMFYSDVSKQTTAVQKKDGNYNIDADGNGVWDYTFDTANRLTSYQQSNTPGFEIMPGICAIAFVFLWRRKKRGSD